MVPAAERYAELNRTGAVVSLRVPCLGNPAGALGVCYEVYGSPERPGASFLFANGQSDGFGPVDQDHALEYRGFCGWFADYRFANLTQLRRDFEDGIFDPVFRTFDWEAS